MATLYPKPIAYLNYLIYLTFIGIKLMVSQRKNNQRLNLSLPADMVTDLKRSGCPSKFIEPLYHAHQEKRSLSASTHPYSIFQLGV
ncbi:MAG: hypothetical protein ABI417_18670 [Coleofasciculaceae cyanobacterium]